MKNQALILEVISQISQRFAPNISDIKKVRSNSLVLLIWANRLDFQGIESLLEKEYMERVDGSNDTFSYVAWSSQALWKKIHLYFPSYTFFPLCLHRLSHPHMYIINASFNLDSMISLILCFGTK